MRKLLPLLTALALGSFALSGCTKDCYGEICDCRDEYANDVVLPFSADTTSAQAPGYRQADLQGAYVVRYARPGYAKPIDSTAYQRPGLTGPTGPYRRAVCLSRLFASRAGSLDEFAQYNYAVVVPRAAHRYQVTDLEITGERQGDKCCRCYVNTRKRLRLNGTAFSGDGKENIVGAVLAR